MDEQTYNALKEGLLESFKKARQISNTNYGIYEGRSPAAQGAQAAAEVAQALIALERFKHDVGVEP